MDLTDETRCMELHPRPGPHAARDPRPYAVIARQRLACSPPDPGLELQVPPFVLVEYYEAQRGNLARAGGGWGYDGDGVWGQDFAGDDGGGMQWTNPEVGSWVPSGRKSRRLQEGKTMAELREMAEEGKLAWGCSLHRQEDSLWLPLRKVRVKYTIVQPPAVN